MSKKASASRGGGPKQKNVSRKLILYFTVFAVLIVALVVVNQQANKASSDNVYGIPTSQLSPQTVDLLDDPNYQNIILPDELDRKIADKESFFLYYFSSTCPYCMQTTPLLNPIIEDAGVNVPQFNLDVYNDGFGKYNIVYTPTLIYYENGVEKERIEGGFGAENNEAKFADFFARNKGAAQS
ncbi:thioredoxin family protein [Paenibacillus antri]|uniref:Thioredoxin family protein n=1 Tax=Paenibacillus antri TaxID=2582848 RepID=A0A5R9GGA0_9BACL|nr:thioredoxin family protein [Paenibacillus antri]TLS54229.1 thioredoxin family protein [Paenibacillus antri]